MKYYEFNTHDFEYYALITAEDITGAKKIYSENVCCLEFENEKYDPIEITKDEAINKIKNSNDYSEDEFSLYDLESESVLLIDSNLL